MKKLLYLSLTSLFVSFMSCGLFKQLDLNQLQFGMSKQEVYNVAGSPNRILSARQTSDGFQEVLEYITARKEVYALEFWNDYLTGFEFVEEIVDYVPPVYPPAIRPEPGRPIIVYPQKPGKPGRPSQPDRPGRPGSTSRPEQPSRPEPPVRPIEPDRPQSSRPGTSTRPGSSTSTRPSTPTSTTRTEQNVTPTRSATRSNSTATDETETK